MYIKEVYFKISHGMFLFVFILYHLPELPDTDSPLFPVQTCITPCISASLCIYLVKLVYPTVCIPVSDRA